MREQLKIILTTVAICLGIFIIGLGSFFIHARIERANRITQEETSVAEKEETIKPEVIITTPEAVTTPAITVTVTPTVTPTPAAAQDAATNAAPTPTETANATPNAVPTPTAAATPDAAPKSTEAAAPTPQNNSSETATNGHIVAIDAGHQRKGNSEKEPNGPGSNEMKAKVSSGTTGCQSGVYEYVVNLDVSLLLRDELERRGYQVVMIRDHHDVNISNSERAAVANNSGAEIFIRIHCNGVDNSSVRGALTMSPTSSNPYVGYMASQCEQLSRVVIDEYCAATGFKNKGIQYYDNMSGINWCQIPVTIVEMGFMSNPQDDAMLVDPSMQVKMAEGIANGVDAYFGL